MMLQEAAAETNIKRKEIKHVIQDVTQQEIDKGKPKSTHTNTHLTKSRTWVKKKKKKNIHGFNFQSDSPYPSDQKS